MRNTPIFLDNKLYHLRYDLNSVWDLDHLLPNGFDSVIQSEIEPELCNLLLWAGIKWETSLSLKDVKKIVEYESKDKKGEAVVGIITTCLDELFQSGWYNKPKESSEPSAKSQPMTVRELIFALEKAAYYCGYPGDPWSLTPNEINYFVAAYNEKHKNDEDERNFRMGMVCAATYNAAGKFKIGNVPWDWSDFVPKKPQTVEDMINIMFATAAALGADKK